MSLRRLILWTCFASVTAACGKSVVAINHTIPARSGNRKPSADCNTGRYELAKLLANERGFNGTQVVFLANNACALQVSFTSTDNVVAAMRTLRQMFQSYTVFKTGKSALNVWIDSPASLPKDSSGKIMNYKVTEAQCNAARDGLKKQGPDGSYLTVIDQGTTKGSMRCYVDAKFGNDSAFESFVNWKNPTAENKEPFHYYVKSGDAMIPVWVHAVAPVNSN